MLSGASDTAVEVLTEFGELLGVAFQLSDDLLDVAGRRAESGKNQGTDLREGVRTLPVLYALQSDDPADGRLHELLLGDLSSDEALEEALDLLREHSAMERARDSLRSWADRARAVLEPLPPSPARSALEALTHFMVARTG
jgi:heptaprenyl diphosphate synthase